MRLKSDIQNGEYLATDLNGFQVWISSGHFFYCFSRDTCFSIVLDGEASPIF